MGAAICTFWNILGAFFISQRYFIGWHGFFVSRKSKRFDKQTLCAYFGWFGSQATT